MGQILFFGNDHQILDTIKLVAKQDNLVAHCADKKALDKLVKTNEYPLIFLDLQTIDVDASEILSFLDFSCPHSNMLVINDPQDSRLTLDQHNLFNIIERPITRKKIQLNIEKVFKNRQFKYELDFLRGQQDSIYNFDSIIAYSPCIQKVFTALKKFAQTDSTIMITGETGTGKSFLSSSVHYNSLRKNKPFVTINCANLPETILDSELFGHEKGAFTGADKTRIGRLEQAHEGTVFLDEVSELNYSMQAKLLRVLEEKAFERVGGNKTIYCDVRIISATNRMPEAQVEEGKLREDLYYRLNVLRVHIPPLRERTECIQPLAEFLLSKNARKLKKRIKGFTQEAIDMILAYNWPGNIRQLQNTIERALILEDTNWVAAENLALVEPSFSDFKTFKPAPAQSEPVAQPHSLAVSEAQSILQALENNDWVQKEAARELGISPRALNYKIKKYGIRHKRWLKHKE